MNTSIKAHFATPPNFDESAMNLHLLAEGTENYNLKPFQLHSICLTVYCKVLKRGNFRNLRIKSSQHSILLFPWIHFHHPHATEPANRDT